MSCDDTTDTLGSTLTDFNDTIHIETEDFSIVSRSVMAPEAVTRSTTAYLGKIKDPQTGVYLTGSYMTQFRPLGFNQFENLDSIIVDDYNPSVEKWKQLKADSCSLVLYFDSFYGDSLAPMKVTAHELAVPYEEENSYSTGYDPIANNMIRTGEGSIHRQLSYTLLNRTYTDAQRQESDYLNNIQITLKEPYTDKDGNVYNNYGTYLMRCYFNPEKSKDFKNQYLFNHNICPGFYFENSGGLGTMAKINSAVLGVYYHLHHKDTVYNTLSMFGGTEEVVQKTTLSEDGDKIQQLVNDNSCTYIKTPVSIYTELTLPVEKIMSNEHKNDTLNTARVFIPRINNQVASDYALSIPSTLLLIEADSVETFFAQRKIADYRNNFLSTYSSSFNGYTFGNISYLITKMYRKMVESGLPVEEYKKRYPNWNKALLVPVETTSSTLSSVAEITKVTHDMSLSATKLLKGDENNKNIVVKVIYSKFNDK